jgi:hypothetical protein
MLYISNELMCEIWFKNNNFFSNYDQIMLIVKLRTSKYQKKIFTHFSTFKENMVTKKTYYEENFLKFDK